MEDVKQKFSKVKSIPISEIKIRKDEAKSLKYIDLNRLKDEQCAIRYFLQNFDISILYVLSNVITLQAELAMGE